jgi:hypothetical protein
LRSSSADASGPKPTVLLDLANVLGVELKRDPERSGGRAERVRVAEAEVDPSPE